MDRDISEIIRVFNSAKEDDISMPNVVTFSTTQGVQSVKSRSRIKILTAQKNLHLMTGQSVKLNLGSSKVTRELFFYPQSREALSS